jgi:hypothetical protein
VGLARGMSSSGLVIGGGLGGLCGGHGAGLDLLRDLGHRYGGRPSDVLGDLGRRAWQRPQHLGTAADSTTTSAPRQRRLDDSKAGSVGRGPRRGTGGGWAHVGR